MTYIPGKRMEEEWKKILDILDKMDEGNRRILELATECVSEQVKNQVNTPVGDQIQKQIWTKVRPEENGD